ncbi:hypothetical protein [Cylindrospermopsis raciborskii]|uniref:hypothetical protein n=1 Tax=Cylindrospermopsis raciborskii TaxID=77022 RepID=UPI0015F1A892|nr:hypothetical protein [Cylindrospermopsis raciborskii]UJL32325.1 hypothetical protein C6N34_008765 [Cylindrospermopsis raciborskii Cr2010]
MLTSELFSQCLYSDYPQRAYFDVHGYPTYGGFPIPENEVPAQILPQEKSVAMGDKTK